MRTTPWDPRENLPREYARVWRFENLSGTARSVRHHTLLHQTSNNAAVGRYIRLVLSEVPADITAHLPRRAGATSGSSGEHGRIPLIANALFRYENQPSLLHFLIKKHPSFPGIIPNKTPLEFVVGFRSFVARPLFSEHNPGFPKQKLERFLHQGRDVVATVYAPIIFPPATVLVYTHPDGDDQSRELVATGSLLSIDPDRIILKKVVLSGHPFKVKNKRAVIRKMFFNADDIRYFKPIELRTKYGRTGRILEPLGTHGHMKCVFDAPLEQRDTVLLNLYKRVFPPWGPDSAFIPDDEYAAFLPSFPPSFSPSH
jgi:pre-rRNA-processing protein TSR1